MKNSEIIAVIEENEQRIVDALKTVDVTEESYMRLLNHIGMGRNIVNALRQQPNPFAAARAVPETPAPESEDAGKVIAFRPPEERASDSENVGEPSETAREEPVPKSEDETSEAVTDHAEAETNAELEPKAKAKKTKTVKPAPKPEPTLTKQDMVTQLTYYSNEKGVNVADVMVSLGFSKLSDVAESQYQTLLDAVKEKAGEA